MSDPTGTLASPVATLQRRKGRRPPLAQLTELAATHEVERVVLGLPLTLQGVEDEWCAEVRRVGSALADRSGLPVVFVDERFSSKQAERAVRSSGLKKTQREEKGRIDAGAATVILQHYLDGAPER